MCSHASWKRGKAWSARFAGRSCRSSPPHCFSARKVHLHGPPPPAASAFAARTAHEAQQEGIRQDRILPRALVPWSLLLSATRPGARAAEIMSSLGHFSKLHALFLALTWQQIL